MSLVDFNDWKEFWKKFKWQLISFKFISFWTFVVLLVLSWKSLYVLYFKSIDTAKQLFSSGFIQKEDVAKLIMHTQTTLFDTALSHMLVFAGAIIGSIIAIKGVSYWTNAQQTKEVIKKISTENSTGDDLKKFLPKR